MKKMEKTFDNAIKSCGCFSEDTTESMEVQCFSEDTTDSEIVEVQCFHCVIKSEARKRYEDYYSSEEQLNDDFRCYISNYKLAYEGKSTREAQVSSKGITEGQKRKFLTAANYTSVYLKYIRSPVRQRDLGIYCI